MNSAKTMGMRLGLLLALVPVVTEAATVPNDISPDAIRDLPVQYQGRWAPLDSVARHLVEQVTGNARFRDKDPLLHLLAWTFNGQEWLTEPLIHIRSRGLREALDLPLDRQDFSYVELSGHGRLREVMMSLRNAPPGQKPDDLQQKAMDINEKLHLIDAIFLNEIIRLIPDAEDPMGSWAPIPFSAAEAPEAIKPLSRAWMGMGQSFLSGDQSTFDKWAGTLKSQLAELPAAHRPTDKQIRTELRFNRLQPFTTAWIIMVIGAVLAALALAVKKRWFDGVAVLAIIAGFGMLTYGLSMRWTIAGRIPAANLFESLLFLSWGMGLFAIISLLVSRNRLLPLTASFMGALALFLADVLPIDSFIKPIAPVLQDTIWMSIHVPEIMVSYSVLTIAVLIAHVQVVAMALVPRKTKFLGAIDRLHYWYAHVGSWLLIIGIITGSMWAASSWGRYWGWDPKEVWSLVAFLGYMAVLHIRVDRARVPAWMYAFALLLGVGLFTWIVAWFQPLTPTTTAAFVGTGIAVVFFVMARGAFAMAVKSIAAFWLIIMTYVGVNFILGKGMHSYAFGKGAVAKYMIGLGTADLAFIALCTLVYLLRGGRMSARSTPFHAMA